MKVPAAQLDSFTAVVWAYYQNKGRHDLPWRQPGKGGALDPYGVLVSEIMLQQTQVPRVIPKFEAFMRAFPTVYELAAASLADVLRLWSGLGYNRRAKFLWQAAGAIVAEHKGVMPRTRQALVKLPGVGPNTAGAILAYAWNLPEVFIETNIRSVYIHHFFADARQVSDTEIMPILQATIPEGAAREWYWALMDYGTHLKQTAGNAARASNTYVKQSAFHGSRRKIRGQVLKALAADARTAEQLAEVVRDERLSSVLKDLTQEGFIVQDGLHYSLAA